MKSKLYIIPPAAVLLPVLFFSSCAPPPVEESPAQSPVETAAAPRPEILQYEPREFGEERIVHTLVVNGSAEGASDENPGTEERPLAGIQAAVARAFQTGTDTEGVRILIAPGLYRETVDIVDWNRDAPLLLEGRAAEGEAVILSGSDRFVDWVEFEELPGVYVHAWTFTFGMEKNPWPGLMPMEDGEGFRRELVFVDGNPMRQVFRREKLTEGTYLVEEEGGRLLLHPPRGIHPALAVVEVSVRPEARFGAHSKLIRVMGGRNVGLRNLRVQHAATLPFSSAAVQFLGTENMLVEDCDIQWNNGEGLSLVRHQGVSPTHVVLRRVRANHNGTLGLTGGMNNGLIEDCETNHNNWRGAERGATGWAPCGFKLSGLKQVLIRNHTANFNHASGGWFDDYISHVTVENFTAVNNFRSGISLEAVDGPLIVRDAVLMGNSTGINFFDSVNVVVEDAHILNNSARGIRIAGSTPLTEEELLRFPEGWRRSRLSKRRSPRDIQVVNSVIGHTEADTGAFLYEFGMRENTFELPDGTLTLAVTLETLHLSGNTYALPVSRNTEGFRDARNQAVSLVLWQELSGQDQDARWDSAAVEAALKAAMETTGLSPDGFGSEDRTRSTQQVDELEL